MASKKIILCDTNILIEYFKGNPNVIKNIDFISQESIYISSITAAELYYGALNKTELNFIRKRLKSIINIPINEEISDLFEELMIKYSLSHKLAIPDAIIASTALYYDIELYTLNSKDFRFIKDIKMYLPKN